MWETTEVVVFSSQHTSYKAINAALHYFHSQHLTSSRIKVRNVVAVERITSSWHRWCHTAWLHWSVFLFPLSFGQNESTMLKQGYLEFVQLTLTENRPDHRDILMQQKHIFFRACSEQWWIRRWHLLISWPVKLEKDLGFQIVLKISKKKCCFSSGDLAKVDFFPLSFSVNWEELSTLENMVYSRRSYFEQGLTC